VNVFDKFHAWLKEQEFDSCYPDEFKVIDYALINPELRIPNLSRRPYQNCHTFTAASHFYSEYGDYKDKVILRREFWQKCRQWRQEFGTQWKLLYREGFEHGRYSSGVWTPVLVEPKLDSPYDAGYGQGRNTTVLERK
jgi:hypothetical protein